MLPEPAKKALNTHAKTWQEPPPANPPSPPQNHKTHTGLAELARKEATALGDCYVGTEHILLALAKLPQVKNCLKTAGVREKTLHKNIDDLLNRPHRPKAHRPPGSL
jgi:ATP-dependent Clp protease ATP-binding subunit ClpA